MIMTSLYDELLEAGRKALKAQQAQQEASKAVAAEIAAQQPPPPPLPEEVPGGPVA